jgi:FMN reductase
MTDSLLRAVVVVGNPKPASRTLAVAEATARALVGADSPVDVVEVCELGPRLFGWGDEEVAAAKAAVLAADVVVIASPVYKASYTGLLKAFLDHFGQDELAGAATVPVMVGAAPIHALAVETQLRPVLVELGAACPSRGLFILEKSLDSLDEQLVLWADLHRDALLAVAAVHQSRRKVAA